MARSVVNQSWYYRSDVGPGAIANCFGSCHVSICLSPHLPGLVPAPRWACLSSSERIRRKIRYIVDEFLVLAAHISWRYERIWAKCLGLIKSSLLFECDLWLSCELAFIACCIISTFRSLGISATQTDRICLTSLILQMSKQEWRICPMTVDDMFTTISKMCIQPARMPHNPLVHGCLRLLFWFPR